jgi:hypothetical protein
VLLAVPKEVSMPEPKHVSDRDGILKMRRALLGDPLSLQTYTWLRPVYLQPPKNFPVAVAKTAIAGMVSALEPMVKKDGKLGPALQSVSRFISAPVAPHYVKAFETIKRPKSSLLGTFVSVVYARAMLLLAISDKDSGKIVAEVKDVLTDPKSFVDRYLAEQGKLDEYFTGHLVTMAELEARLDPHFEKVLEQAGALFVETHRPSQSSRNPLTEPGSRLELLNDAADSAWWRLPISLAFTMTVWHQVPA